MALHRKVLATGFALLMSVASMGAVAATTAPAKAQEAGVIVRDIEGHQVYCLKSHPNVCRQGAWLLLTSSPDNALFVNERLNKSRHVAWLLAMPNAKSKTKEKSTVAAFQFDCKNQEWTSLSVTVYDQPWGKGKVLDKTKAKSSPQLVEPGTLQETLMEMVCPGY